MHKKTLLFFLSAILLACLIFAAAWILQRRTAGVEDPNAVKWEDTVSGGEDTKPSGISIPGYENLIFPAGKENVPLTLHNPQVNDCYFQFVLYLDDDTSPLFTSGYVKPGYTLETARLTHMIDPGEYTLHIQINTFSMDTLEQMNNAVIKASLIVV